MRRGRQPVMRMLSVALLVLATIVLAACGGDGGSDAAGGADVARGEELFVANCSPCHGEGATGTSQGPPLVHEVYEPSHHSDDSFRSAVANGVQPHHWQFGPMPPLPGVAGDEVEAIIAYVRSLQREAGIE